MKIYLEQDVGAPIYIFDNESYFADVECEVDENTYKKWQRIQKKFNEMQESLKKIYTSKT